MKDSLKSDLRRGKAKTPVHNPSSGIHSLDPLYEDIRHMITESRRYVASTANMTLTLMYWKIGRRIWQETLNEKRAEYGKQVLNDLSQKLSIEFGDGYSAPNLARMVKFATVFKDKNILSTLSIKLSWSHFVEILGIKDEVARNFYAEMCRIEGWSVRTLQEKINGHLYERTAISKKPKNLIEKELHDLRETNKMSPDLIFKDPYMLNFLGLKDTYSEKDLESAILREIESFLVELGSGFCFAGRQKRITIDNEDYYLDLLFFHRKLHRLIAVELKLGKFKAADKGQMELYLRWLEKYEREPEEEAPLGLILVGEKGNEHVELLELDKSNIRVSQYLTKFPPRKILEQRLQAAIEQARQRFTEENAGVNKGREIPPGL